MLFAMKTSTSHIAAALAILLGAAHGCALAQSGPDYSDPISTDRPDFVDSSAVVGKGRVQIETAGAFERSRRDGVTERSVTTPTLLRFGLNDTVELRVETDGATHSWSRGLDVQDASGMADSALGLKWHVRDSADGAPALAVRVNAVVPSGARRLHNGGVEMSLRGVAEWDLPHELSLGVMPGLASARNDNGERFTSGIFGVVLGRDWNPRVHSYVELAAPRIAHARDGGSQVAAGFGSTYLLSPNAQVDAGILGGLNHFTPHLSLTAGLSVKL
jgi:hypothetical protein